MKTKLLMVVVLAFMTAGATKAQETAKSPMDKVWFVDASVFACKSHNGLMPEVGAVTGGLKPASWIQLFGRLEREITRYKHGEEKQWFSGLNAGGGIAFMHSAEDGEYGALRMCVLNSINNSNWSHTIYQVSYAYYGKPLSKNAALFSEIGYRYNKSHTHDKSDCGGVFIGIGFCF